MIARVDLSADLRETVEEHRRVCRCKLKEEKRTFGFEIFYRLYCDFCKREYNIRTGPKPTDESASKETPKRRGQKPSMLNMMVAGAAHKSAISVTHLTEFCHEVGCVSPSETGLFKMMDVRKNAVRTVANRVLKENRKEHVAAIKKEFGDKQIIKSVDSEGKTHHICYGPAAADGAGAKRAYNHIITGSQHSTILFSMVTGKVLAVRNDQVSCALCERKLSKLLNENKRAEEITADDLTHEGKCARNSKYDPAVAEEHALEGLAESLLIDPETGKLLPDDEAILVNYFISDGDTKGAKRFIRKQAEIVPEFDGTADYLPDIGHFIKTISNALHSLASKNSNLRGVDLLEAARIKSICSDITGIIKRYGKKYKEIQANKQMNDDARKTELEKCRTAAMSQIHNIVPHHCNDHSGCDAELCFVAQRRRGCILAHRIEYPNSELTDEEIIEQSADKIAKEHAKEGRFRGKHMSMGKKGQASVMAEITSRLDLKSIDRVATNSSSNRCENFFGCLTKYTQGKRLYLGRTDSYEIIQLYVAATINNPKAAEIENEIRKLMGISFQPTIREAAIAKDEARKKYHQRNKKREAVIHQRRLRKIVTTAKAAKNAKNTARHKPGKLSPKEDCKSTNEKTKTTDAAEKEKKKRKRASKCKNCNTFHHGPCQEPTYDIASAKKKKQKKEKILGGFTSEDILALMKKHA